MKILSSRRLEAGKGTLPCERTATAFSCEVIYQVYITRPFPSQHSEMSCTLNLSGFL